VELDELEIGEPRAGPVGHRQAVPGRDVRVARVAVDLATAAGREDHAVREVGAPHLRPAVEDPAADHPPRVGAAQSELLAADQVDAEVVLVDRDRPVLEAAGEQRVFQHAARRVLAVQDPPAGMPALAAEIEGGVRRRLRALEVRPQAQQALDQARTGLDHPAHHVLVAETIARREGVLDVQLEIVQRGEHGGDSPLGVVRVAFAGVLLGDDPDRALRGREQGKLQPRDPGSDDQGTTLARIVHTHGNVPVRIAATGRAHRRRSPGHYNPPDRPSATARRGRSSLARILLHPRYADRDRDESDVKFRPRLPIERLVR